jgi:hypothetical protein
MADAGALDAGGEVVTDLVLKVAGELVAEAKFLAQRCRPPGVIEQADALRTEPLRRGPGMSDVGQRASDYDPIKARQYPGDFLLVTFDKPVDRRASAAYPRPCVEVDPALARPASTPEPPATGVTYRTDQERSRLYLCAWNLSLHRLRRQARIYLFIPPGAFPRNQMI